MDGQLWTIQYIKEDGAKRFAKNSRKHGCFHVVGAPNGAAASAKNSVVSGGGYRRRLRDGGVDSEARESAGASGVRFREFACGGDLYTRALAREKDRDHGR